MPKHKWTYGLNPKTYMCGTMICRVCNKKITEGEFKAAITQKANIVIHKKCCATDQGWIVLKRKREKALSEAGLKLRAYIIFRDKWNTDSLDIDISNIKSNIANLKEALY